MAKNVTAFVLSQDVAGAADGVTIPGVPGLWFHDQAILPSALEFTVAEMREAISTLGLPLDEVTVPERKASEGFQADANKLPSGKEGRGGVEFGGPETVPVLDAPDENMLDETLERAAEIEQERTE